MERGEQKNRRNFTSDTWSARRWCGGGSPEERVRTTLLCCWDVDLCARQLNGQPHTSSCGLSSIPTPTHPPPSLQISHCSSSPLPPQKHLVSSPGHQPPEQTIFFSSSPIFGIAFLLGKPFVYLQLALFFTGLSKGRLAVMTVPDGS